MKEKASGTPPVLAKTPEAAIMARRITPSLIPTTATAINSPATAAITVAITESLRLATNDWR